MLRTVEVKFLFWSRPKAKIIPHPTQVHLADYNVLYKVYQWICTLKREYLQMS